MRRRIYRATTVSVVALLVAASSASASNWADVRLDVAASTVAGHSVQVWCESSITDWLRASSILGRDTSFLYGFTLPARSTTIYIAPAQCATLHALLDNGPAVVGNYWGSLAVHTLVHESEHQAGHVDEGETDCAALAVDADIAVQFFGYATTEKQPYVATVTRARYVTVKGVRRLIRWTTQVIRNQSVPSTRLAEFQAWDRGWHRSLPAEYQGGC